MKFPQAQFDLVEGWVIIVSAMKSKNRVGKKQKIKNMRKKKPEETRTS